MEKWMDGWMQVSKRSHQKMKTSKHLYCYSQVVEIAKQETKIYNDSDLAVQEFRKILNSSESYFDDPIPKNESDEDAHRKCSDLAGAEKYCPARWAAIQKWFKEARKVS